MPNPLIITFNFTEDKRDHKGQTPTNLYPSYLWTYFYYADTVLTSHVPLMFKANQFALDLTSFYLLSMLTPPHKSSIFSFSPINVWETLLLKRFFILKKSLSPFQSTFLFPFYFFFTFVSTSLPPILSPLILVFNPLLCWIFFFPQKITREPPDSQISRFLFTTHPLSPSSDKIDDLKFETVCFCVPQPYFSSNCCFSLVFTHPLPFSMLKIMVFPQVPDLFFSSSFIHSYKAIQQIP